METTASPEQQQQEPKDGAAEVADAKASTSTPQVHLRPSDPFDLEAYIAPYAGE